MKLLSNAVGTLQSWGLSYLILDKYDHAIACFPNKAEAEVWIAQHPDARAMAS